MRTEEAMPSGHLHPIIIVCVNIAWQLDCGNPDDRTVQVER
jgi:hypothetical protein